MENEHLDHLEPEQEKPVYVPRPKWQIVLAWIGIAIVLIGFGTYLYQIATAGGI